MPAQPWPLDLDYCFIIRGYSESQEPTTIRSEVDTGPAKVRRRFTKAVGLAAGEFVFSYADVKKFWTFFNVTLQNGSLPFAGKSPITGDVGDYRFIEQPVVSAFTEKYCTISVAVERI